MLIDFELLVVLDMLARWFLLGLPVTDRLDNIDMELEPFGLGQWQLIRRFPAVY
jgi:hypothetical protein